LRRARVFRDAWLQRRSGDGEGADVAAAWERFRETGSLSEP
jgi:hypothetical protein